MRGAVVVTSCGAYLKSIIMYSLQERLKEAGFKSATDFINYMRKWNSEEDVQEILKEHDIEYRVPVAYEQNKYKIARFTTNELVVAAYFEQPVKLTPDEHHHIARLLAESRMFPAEVIIKLIDKLHTLTDFKL